QRDQLGPLMLRLSDHAIDPRLPFDAPLALALPWVPLTFLPLELAFHVWQIVTLGLLLLALMLMARWLPLGHRALPLAIAALLAGGVNGLLAMVWSALEAGQGVVRYNDSLIGTVSPLLPGRIPTFLGFGLWALALAALALAAFRWRAHAIGLPALAPTVAILF